MAEMRQVAKELAGRDREMKTTLVRRRRAAGLEQADIDKAFGFPAGWTRQVVHYGYALRECDGLTAKYATPAEGQVKR